jgi:outer membrane protein
MKHSLAVAFLGLALIIAAMVKADAAVGAAKVAVIDIERTLTETSSGTKASKAFDDARTKKQGELDKQQKELQTLASQLEKQRMVLKPDVLKQRQAELEQKFVEVQQLYVKLERDLSGERAKLIQEILKKAAPVIEQVAQAEGVTLVVDRSSVLWADKSVDLTDTLIKKMK